MKKIRKLFGVAVAMALCLILAAPALAEDNSARIAEIEAQIAALQAELKELKGETSADVGSVLYQDESIIITYDGMSGEEDDYDINFVIENLSSKTLSVQVRETSINGFMVDPTCSMEIAPGKKAKDGMHIWGDDGKNNPLSGVENVETKFYIFNSDDWSDSVTTENIIIM